jgi:twitching motility protein PilI
MSKTFNLREFQSSLSRRLQVATTRETAFSRLGFAVGETRWMVALDQAEEVIPVPVIIPVPGTQRWFRGMVNVRGNLYAVTDFADFLHRTPTPESPHCRLLIPHHQYKLNAALLVSSTLGLKNIGGFSPATHSTAVAWATQSYTDAAAIEWIELDFPALLSDAGFMKVEALARG